METKHIYLLTAMVGSIYTFNNVLRILSSEPNTRPPKGALEGVALFSYVLGVFTYVGGLSIS